MHLSSGKIVPNSFAIGKAFPYVCKRINNTTLAGINIYPYICNQACRFEESD